MRHSALFVKSDATPKPHSLVFDVYKVLRLFRTLVCRDNLSHACHQIRFFEGVQGKSRLSIEVKKGTFPHGPDLYGPIKVGEFLTPVLKLKGYSPDHDMRVTSCWAFPGSSLSQ
jgi:hypothetical protein